MNTPLKSHSPPQPGVGLVVVGQKSKPINKPLMDMTAAVYFDGTGNNRTNVTYRIHAQHKEYNAQSVIVNGHTMPFTDSYGRGYSNIAILEYMSVVAPNHVSIYIGGAGAPSGAYPDQLGNAFGVGPTGVPNAVTRAIGEVTKAINKKLKAKGAQLGKLRVDVFGFSRGAAAARHFVARRTGQHFNFFGPYNDLISSLQVRPTAITINFVGLYDTVSSYGGENTGRKGATLAYEAVISTSKATRVVVDTVGLGPLLDEKIKPVAPKIKSTLEPYTAHGTTEEAVKLTTELAAQAAPVQMAGDHPFGNNVELLHLAIGGDATYVVQLAAGDEYRKLFPRTTIDSSVNAGKGFECVVPGSHGDVGGGYNPRMTEVYTAYTMTERNRLINEGWFKSQELTTLKEDQWHFRNPFSIYTGIIQKDLGSMLTHKTEVLRYMGTRQLVPDYQFVTLGLMLDLASKHGVEFARLRQRNLRWQVPLKLKPLYHKMHAYVMGRLHTSGPNVFNLVGGIFQGVRVRHQYLHLSSVMAGKGSFPNKLQGLVLGAREVNGVPTRQIIRDDAPGHYLPAHYKQQDYLVPPVVPPSPKTTTPSPPPIPYEPRYPRPGHDALGRPVNSYGQPLEE
ncbi:DUF2235 domain-containing protein [Hymenobacter psoromatis]|uniref:DUF2235 domain-containing protein n=1 Tax=Hymenobacter psoromatis TaxID=1484116 RepID=UPI001CBC94F5|nr:DUF2235 domain-containing protein [Hymenobacter psoromatis]